MKEIKLTRGYVALIDDEDFERINKLRWQALVSNRNKTIYAVCKIYALNTVETIFLHRLILKIEDKSITVDHKDGNGLNNVKLNLRLATHRQQQFNRKSKVGSSSKYKGVSYNNKDKIWIAQIRINGKNTKLGRFKSEIEAALKYNEFALKYHGEFASLNIISV